MGALILARGDVSEVPHTVEEVLDEIVLPIDPACEGKPLLWVGPRRNVGQSVLSSGGVTESVTALSLVTKKGCPVRHRFQPRLGFLTVVEQHDKQASLAVAHRVELEVQASFGVPDASG